eukprot:3799575-Rhodomonas_salina.4
MVRVSLRASSNGKLYDLDVNSSTPISRLLEQTVATAIYYEGQELPISEDTVFESILAAAAGNTELESAAFKVLTPHHSDSLVTIGTESGQATSMPKILPHGG